MNKIWNARYPFMLAAAMFLGVLLAGAQGHFSVITGKTFDGALPREFYLEGNAIPTQKRNAALMTTPAGTRLLVALLDTSGYSSQVQEKYTGMLINEGSVTVCGKSLGVGSFGFGLKTPAGPGAADATFLLYDQSGKEVLQCAVKRDARLERPAPLQIVLNGGSSASLSLGRYEVVFKP
jgi:hypothetical protein